MSSWQLFISYSRTDAAAVTYIHDQLAAAGHDVWRDVDRLHPGDAFRGEIFRQIRQRDGLVACLSRSACRSPEVTSEVETARDMRKRIIPVFLEPVDDLQDGLVFLFHGLDRIEWWQDSRRGLQRLLAALDSAGLVESSVVHPRSAAELVNATEFELSAAAEELADMISYGRSDVKVRTTLGVVRLYLRDFDGAAAALDGALRLDPRDPRALVFRAVAALRGNRPRATDLRTMQRIERALQTARLVAPDHGTASILLGVLKQDFYRGNHLDVPAPSVESLLVEGVERGIDQELMAHLHALLGPLDLWRLVGV